MFVNINMEVEIAPKNFSLTSKEKYVIIKENGMSVKFYDRSNFDENNGYYRLC